MLGLNAIDVCGPKDSVIWECATIDGREGRRVRLTLSDTGPGLTPQAQRSATDLYYSGREHGRGLGVSLAMVQRVIEMHQGTFALRSEFGAGCRVEIELPATDAPIASRPTLNL
jgi:signal transduction histidine kinase